MRSKLKVSKGKGILELEGELTIETAEALKAIYFFKLLQGGSPL